MYEKNCKLVFTDLVTGEMLTIGHGIWEIEELDGIFAPDFTLYTKSRAEGRGVQISGKQIKGRDITVVACVTDTTQNDIQRLRANRFFNPLHSFTVHITYYGTTRWSECELIGINCPQADMDEPTNLKLMVTCPNALLKSVDNFGKDISTIDPKFTFPFISTIEKGFNFGYYSFANEVNVINDGDVETQCKIIFTANGYLKNPKLSKNNSKYVRILKEMNIGDEIVIDFENGKITFNGERCTSIDRGSTFFYLDRGNNKLTASADVNIANLSTVIYYNSEYLGV